ncbi:MAG: hypothetical protein COS34_05750 [Lysobacterales bacterium CG02_land_8_20_14_3_00_62_12]|nr:MAG: hypothetical protein COS34_05750 [Xanthomonadales bacterium CG02_land_8_20_14_3_00_62_12]
MPGKHVSSIVLDQLHFDPLNPRLPSSLHQADDEKVLEYLLLECNVVELMLSIGEKGYFGGEPLLVVSRSAPETGYWVVEGNRRLGALKLLASNVPAPIKPREVEQARAAATHRPNDIPALVFQRREEILGYLGYRHITGIKEWSPLAKARYLKQLRAQYDNDHVAAHKALARTIGSKSTNVAKLLVGYALLEHARDTGLLNEIKQSEDDIDFSLLTTGIGYEGIQKFVGLKGIADVELAGLKDDEFNEFFKWVFDRRRSSTVLGESRKFKELNRIVVHAEALSAVRRGEDIDTAFLYTSGPLEALRNFMMEAEKSLKAAQETSIHVTCIDDSDVAHAYRLIRAATNLHVSLKSSAAEDSSDAGS